MAVSSALLAVGFFSNYPEYNRVILAALRREKGNKDEKAVPGDEQQDGDQAASGAWTRAAPCPC